MKQKRRRLGREGLGWKKQSEGFCVWQIVDIGRRPDEVIEDDLRVEFTSLSPHPSRFVLMLLRFLFSPTFARAITFYEILAADNVNG